MRKAVATYILYPHGIAGFIGTTDGRETSLYVSRDVNETDERLRGRMYELVIARVRYEGATLEYFTEVAREPK